MIPSFPPHAAGLRVGLYGGSFNPPHEGHRHVALLALRRLRLDRLWFLVTPGNPLKDHNGLPSLEARLAATRKVVAHPAIDVTGIEAALGSELTIDGATSRRSSRLPWSTGRAPPIWRRARSLERPSNASESPNQPRRPLRISILPPGSICMKDAQICRLQPFAPQKIPKTS